MIAVIEIANGSCDTDQDHAILGMVYHPEAKIWYSRLYVCAKFDSKFSRSRDIIEGPKI